MRLSFYSAWFNLTRRSSYYSPKVQLLADLTTFVLIMSDITGSDLIPWSWTITPLDSTEHVCPSPSHILGVFGMVNGISSVVSLISGNRIVVKRLSWRILGKADSNTWMITWILQAGLMLGANAFNAWLTVNARGYDSESRPKIWDLMLFYCARPRLSWIALLIAETIGEHTKGHQWWGSAALQSLITEIVMVLLGSYYMGRLLHDAAMNGYLLPHHLDGFQYKSDYYLMASGSILYLILAWFSLLVLGPLLCISISEGLAFNQGTVMVFVLVVALLPWMASWLFFSGFVIVAGPL
jgi:hypothetical protein